MVSISDLQTASSLGQLDSLEYLCRVNVNLYSSPSLNGLVTQAAAGRQLRILPLPLDSTGKITGLAIKVCLCEDDYPGWLAIEDLDLLEVAETVYQAIALCEEDIRSRLASVIAFTYMAMEQANHYLWGGTVGPNYDCSGLMQTAFASAGVWLPRDSYQQEAFTQPVSLEQVQPGDLVFFGTPEKTTHVGLCLGEGYYIHSSGKDQGRNGIGIDQLSDQGDTVSQTYYHQLRGAGRVIQSYQPPIQKEPLQ